jgi:hypothetical protein
MAYHELELGGALVQQAEQLRHRAGRDAGQVVEVAVLGHAVRDVRSADHCERL